jgi:hypothetical protein
MDRYWRLANHGVHPTSHSDTLNFGWEETQQFEYRITGPELDGLAEPAKVAPSSLRVAFVVAVLHSHVGPVEPMHKIANALS